MFTSHLAALELGPVDSLWIKGTVWTNQHYCDGSSAHSLCCHQVLRTILGSTLLNPHFIADKTGSDVKYLAQDYTAWSRIGIYTHAIWLQSNVFPLNHTDDLSVWHHHQWGNLPKPCPHENPYPDHLPRARHWARGTRWVNILFSFLPLILCVTLQ